MANRKSPSSVQSAPKDKRLAAFAAQIEAEASGTATGQHANFATALNKRNVIQCSKLWLNFANHVTSCQHGQVPGSRVLICSFDLPPLP